MDYIIILILGLEFGSFANACIYRWPLNLSVLYPRRSFCPWCKRKIQWWENIPLLSFVLLKGKCPNCRSEISFQYPLVELSVPILWIAYFLFFKNSAFSHNFIFICLIFMFLFSVVVSTVTDIEWRIIPDEIAVLMFSGSLSLSPWNSFLNGDGTMNSIQRSLLGVMIGGGLLIVLSQLGKYFFEREAMGWGDIKLMAGYGAFLGPIEIANVLFWGAVLGCVVVMTGLFLSKLRRYQYVPFAPFLNFGALIVLFKSLSKL